MTGLKDKWFFKWLVALCLAFALSGSACVLDADDGEDTEVEDVDDDTDDTEDTDVDTDVEVEDDADVEATP